MDIAIIGAGNVGRSLATAFTAAGHTVVVASRDPEDAGAVAAATGATVAESNAAAAEAAQIVVIATPFSSVVEVARRYREFAGALVVDDADAASADAVEATGVSCVVTPTVMSSPAIAAALAGAVLAAV